ncbi:MAG TPA: MBL fold metallo-hydrolase [Thermoanaerobaculia bacterium]|nr:MBL fold metallo-hydrolase [Thermoanaerobaculia bacterium]
MPSTLRLFAVLFLVLAASPLFAASDADQYDVVKLADGVYGLFWREGPFHPEPNTLIVINDSDVLVVDSSLFPSTSRTIIAEIRTLTPKPVRYVVNTHWHDDHVNGNGAFREAWPGVEFIAHPNTRIDAAAKAFGTIEKDIKENAANLEKYQAILRSGKKSDGTPLTDDLRKQVERVVAHFARYAAEIGKVHPVLPDVTFDQNLTLQRGSRTIELHFLGRGNTRGDVVVYLPKEKILATGDLVVAPSPFGIGSYYSDWIATLNELMKLDASTIFLSHGPLQHDYTYVRTLRDLLAALVSRVSDAVAKGASLEDVKKTVTLDDWKKKLAGDDDLIARGFDAFFVAPAVERAYRQAKGEPDEKEGEGGN